MKNKKSDVITQKQAQIFRQALELHQSGNLDAAEQSYKKLLKSLPCNAMLLSALGMIALQKGHIEEAIRVLAKSLKIAPDQADVLNNLGNAYKDWHRLDEALDYYDQAIAVNPFHADAYFNRGLVLDSLNRLDEALASYDRSIELDSENLDVHFNRGITLQGLNRLDDALNSYQRVITLDPDYVYAYVNQGIVLRELNQLDQALVSYNHAISLYQNDDAIYCNQGNVLLDLNRLDEALASYEYAIYLNSKNLNAHYNRGIVLNRLNRFDAAIMSYDNALLIDPNYVDAYINRGIVLQNLQRLEDALACYDIAINIDQNHEGAYYNRGIVLQLLNRVDEALSSFNRVININPDNINANWGKSLIKLLMGDYIDGWRLYEWRWLKNPLIRNNRQYSQPLWLGEQLLTGKTLFIYPEQGLGDYIQFCRYAILVKQWGAKLVLEVPSALRSVISTLCDQAVLVEAGQALPDFDYHCPIMSLPLAFNTTVETIPSPIPYLRIDQKKKAEWQQRLGENTKFRVGLVWSGSQAHISDSQRSFNVKTFLPLLELPIEFHCLQKEIRTEDREFLATIGTIKTHHEYLNDFSDTAVLIELMDLVLSVDTSVAHLAGALAKNVWILLQYAPDYRWMLNREDSPWYPTATLLRQPAIGDWDSVIIEIKKRLNKLL